MEKMPSVFRRDTADMSRLTREPHPDARWVLDGEGVATRKYDGTCVMLRLDPVNDNLIDGAMTPPRPQWYARRQVKPGKTPPPNYEPVEHDENTGKTFGWEPAEQSGFVTPLLLAVADAPVNPVTGEPEPWTPGTYELLGPKVGGNPDRYETHTLVKHADAEQVSLDGVALTYEGLGNLVVDLYAERGWEGIVFHHPDGRMAKIKGRDFPDLLDERGLAR